MTLNVIRENRWGDVVIAPIGKELQQLVINHHTCTARLSLYGGQVLAWQPSGEQEVFWLSNDSLYQTGKAIRGGIPLCWPWFGGYKDGGNHGFARQVVWQIKHIDVLETEVLVELVWQGEHQHSLWPHHAKLTQRLTFGKRFSQSLTIDNLSAHNIEFTAALHSYFNVSDPCNVKIPRLDDVSFDCKITGKKAIEDKLSDLVGPIDRIYYSDNTMEIIDKGLSRTIVLSPTNVNNWVLWNPGSAIAKTMSDVHRGAENEYICLEAANTDWINVPAGKTATMAQTINLIKHDRA